MQPEHGEDVTWAGRIFASLQTSSKLTNRHQNIDVVTAYKVLCQVDDSCHQRLLDNTSLPTSVFVGSLFILVVVFI